jgi:hypothetical protein
MVVSPKFGSDEPFAIDVRLAAPTRSLGRPRPPQG